MSADPETTKQQAEFMAWGMPTIYIATSAIVLGAFVPHFRANSDYLKANITGYVGKLAVFSAINIMCSIFLFFSPAIHYSLINFALNFMVLCTVSLPAFPKDFAKPLALIFAVWTMIFTGVAPSGMSPGILNTLASSNCQYNYKYVPSVTNKICKDGWVTFTVFCAIVTIGLTFLANLLLIAVATDPAFSEPSSAATEETVNYTNTNNNGGYQQPAVSGADGSYQSYQNPDNQVA